MAGRGRVRCRACLTLTLLTGPVVIGRAAAGRRSGAGHYATRFHAGRVGPWPLGLCKLLHAIAHAFQLRQRLLDVALVAGAAFTGLALLLQRGLRLLELIAQPIESHRHSGLAHPGVHSLPLPDPLGAFAHA